MPQQNNSTNIRPSIIPMNIVQAMVGLGFDDTDQSVLQYFNFFVKQVPTTAVYFLHVLPKFNLMNALYEKESELLISESSINDEVIKKLEQKTNAAFSQRENVYIEFDVKEGNPLEELLKNAEELNLDLLVIGQSRTERNHKILAKNLARKSPANALIIPQGAPQKISHILIPIDFSENAGRALKSAVALHKQLEHSVQITCLYIYRIPNINYFKTEPERIQVKKTTEANIRNGFNAFIHTNTPEYRDKINIALVEKTQPGIAQFILNYADQNECDFLFLGAKGHSNVHRLLMGSVTEELLDTNNNIPTLIIK